MNTAKAQGTPDEKAWAAHDEAWAAYLKAEKAYKVATEAYNKAWVALPDGGLRYAK